MAHAGAWVDLEILLGRRVRHGTGAALPIAAAGIDCSDGQTSDAAYAFVRKHTRPDREVLALKGASDAVGKVEIWTPPKKLDPNARATKAARVGVLVHIVGAAKAKDLILGWSENAGRVRLEGDGPGRMHWFEGVRDDFYEQLLSEIKIPSRMNPAKRVWKARTDRRNEALDCTVYAIYLYRHKRLHLRKPSMWDLVEQRIRQAPLMLEGDDGVFELPPQELAIPTSRHQPDPFADPVENDSDVTQSMAPPLTPQRAPPPVQRRSKPDEDLFAPIDLQ